LICILGFKSKIALLFFILAENTFYRAWWQKKNFLFATIIYYNFSSLTTGLKKQFLPAYTINVYLKKTVAHLGGRSQHFLSWLLAGKKEHLVCATICATITSHPAWM
jgi:hypothetical protein